MPLDSLPYDDLGAPLLAQTPPALSAMRDRRADEPDPSWPVTYDHLQSRLAALRNWRHPWWAHAARIAEFVLPYRYKYLVTANQMNRGGPVNEKIVNETATLAMQICANGLLSGLMSGSWFQLMIADPEVEPDADAREWLEDTEERIYTVLAGSNWYTAMAQAFRDVATFGTSPITINEDREDVIRCYVPSFGEYYLAASARLSDDVLYREYTYTVSQLIDEFGLEHCPTEVRLLWERAGAALEQEFVVGHAIEPNFPLSPKGINRAPVRPVPGGFPWREVYWLRNLPTPRPLRLKGCHERPFAVMLWSKTGNDAYGRGPGHDGLPGTAGLQQIERRTGEYVDKGVRPPMGADPELDGKPSTIISGQITYINTAGGRKGFWPLYEVSPQWMPALTQLIGGLEKRINRCWFTDVFLMISQMEGVQPRNELEIMERKGERVQQLGPMVQLFETETVPHALKRVTAIMQRFGMLRPLPASLRGVALKIDFRSTLKLLLRAGETAALERGLQFGARLSQAAKEAQLPDPLRILDLEKGYRHYLNRIAYPAKAVRSEDEVRAFDKDASRRAAQQQALGMTLAGLKAAEGAGKIDVGGGQTAVQALLGTGPAAPIA